MLRRGVEGLDDVEIPENACSWLMTVVGESQDSSDSAWWAVLGGLGALAWTVLDLDLSVNLDLAQGIRLISHCGVNLFIFFTGPI